MSCILLCWHTRWTFARAPRRTIKKPPFRSFITERAHYSSHAPLPHSNHPPLQLSMLCAQLLSPLASTSRPPPTRNHISVLLNAFTDSPFLQTVFFFVMFFFVFILYYYHRIYSFYLYVAFAALRPHFPPSN